MTLAFFASHPDRSRGRAIAIADSALRDCFARDRDRIVHSTAFRRLKHKTQVFVAPEGDHFRTRLTHSLEVAQIGRVIARALRLNEDLTEALCLAHDLGHPPFGHVGEDALDAAMEEAGGFDHNGHTLRIVTRLEQRYAAYDGLNLSWEVLEGLAKHNGPVENPGWALAETDAAFPLHLDTHGSLEAQVAAIADDIAYDNHDLDDGLRAGLFTLDEALEVPLVAENWRAVGNIHTGAEDARLIAEMVRRQIGAMVEEVLAETRTRLSSAGVETADDVRQAGRALVAFPQRLEAEERRLKRFLNTNMYHHRANRALREPAAGAVRELFAILSADADLLPEPWRLSLPAGEPQRARHVGDFIAGMTDRYAVNFLSEIGGTIGDELRVDGYA